MSFARIWVYSQIVLKLAKGELTIYKGQIVPNILEGWDEEEEEYKEGLGKEIIVEVLRNLKVGLVGLMSGVEAKVMTHSWNLTEYQQFKKWTHIGTPQNNVTVEFYDEECAMLDHKRLKDYDMVRTECNKTAECITNEEGVCQTNLKPGEYAGLLVYENATKKP